MATSEEILVKTNDDLDELIDSKEGAAIFSAFSGLEEPPLQSIFDTYPTLSENTQDASCFEAVVSIREESPVEQTSYTTQQRHRSSLYTNKKYRIHFGTRPGSHSREPLTFEQCQLRHEKLITLLTQIRAQLENLQMKQFLFKIIHSTAISTNQTWEVEPYACIIFESCSLEMVEGVAAIIGRILRQDAIGIFHDGDDYRDHYLGETEDQFYTVHRFFSISRFDQSSELSISNDDAHKLMATIREKYSNLSGQFGKSNKTIELHDFENIYDEKMIEKLKEIIEEVSVDANFSYQINESKINSRLLEEKEYPNAIKNAGLELLDLLIQATHLQNTMYPTNRAYSQ